MRWKLVHSASCQELHKIPYQASDSAAHPQFYEFSQNHRKCESLAICVIDAYTPNDYLIFLASDTTLDLWVCIVSFVYMLSGHKSHAVWFLNWMAVFMNCFEYFSNIPPVQRFAWGSTRWKQKNGLRKRQKQIYNVGFLCFRPRSFSSVFHL